MFFLTRTCVRARVRSYHPLHGVPILRVRLDAPGEGAFEDLLFTDIEDRDVYVNQLDSGRGPFLIDRRFIRGCVP